MAEVYLSPEIASPQYEALRGDPRKSRALEKVDRILDAIEEDPGQRWLRSQRFQTPPVWCVTFDVDGEAWAILWSLDDKANDHALVDYIGPADFR